MTELDTFEALKYRIEVNCIGTTRYYNANNEYHREDGPAIEFTGGSKVWFLNGIEFTEEEFNQWKKENGRT